MDIHAVSNIQRIIDQKAKEMTQEEAKDFYYEIASQCEASGDAIEEEMNADDQ